MNTYSINNYHGNFYSDNTNVCSIVDDLGGFDENYFSTVLHEVVQTAKYHNANVINTGYVFNDLIKNQYPEIEFLYNQSLIGGNGWEAIGSYNVHPDIHYKNFICSFIGAEHVSRKLLVAILERFGYFNPDYCSKNLVFTVDTLDGHIHDYVDNCNNFYRKFFIANNSDVFFNKVNSFGHVRFDHARNIYNLEHKLTQSFLHIVSESIASSYYPFVTEKFLYSIVTRGLFLAYAPPEWHNHLEKYYGFKRYTKLFDYRFDTIKNPVERLVELITMISKFSVLSADDWKDLYYIEQDTIEYNYNHYFSGDYLKCLSRHE